MCKLLLGEICEHCEDGSCDVVLDAIGLSLFKDGDHGFMVEDVDGYGTLVGDVVHNTL